MNFAWSEDQETLRDAAAEFGQRVLTEGIEERESTILRMRFGFGGESPMTLREIGHRLGITRERVRQIQNDALAKLYVSLSPGRGGP